MITVRPTQSAALLLLSLSGCTSAGTGYPSLAPRAVEKRGFEEPETVAVVARPDPALDAKLRALSETVDRIDAGFGKAAATAQRSATAARGRKAGSEAWITAQTDLAQLDDLRAQSSTAMTDIDQLAIDRAATLAPDYPALGALKDKAQAKFEAQSTTITRLQASLAPA